MQRRRLIVYAAQVLLLAASAVSGGTAVRQEVGATTADPVTVLHVAPAPHQQTDLPVAPGLRQPFDPKQVECQPVRTHEGDSHHFWLRDDTPADDRTGTVSGS